jgi:hypothetical protein
MREDGMKTFSEAALKKAILARETERLKHGSAFGASRSELGALRKNRQAAEKILSQFLRNAGLDLNRLRELNEKRSAETKRLVERNKADAVKLASRRKGASYSEIAARSGLMRWQEPDFTLTNPFIVWSIPTIPGVEPAITPQGATAKFKLTTSEFSGWQKVGFHYLWSNPYSDYAVIDVATTLSAIGYIQAHAPWGSFSENNSMLTATSLLNLWIGWPDSEFVTSSSFYQQGLGNVWAYASLFDCWFHDTDGLSIASETYPWAGPFAVPPGALVVFEVAMELDYSNASGDVEADFASGDFNIVCLGVSFGVLNNVLNQSASGVR